MGYSKSLKTLRAMEPNLQLLAQGKPTSWRVLDQPAGDFAYRVREALYNAKFYNPAASPELARAYGLFKITVDGEFVRARLKNPGTVQQVTAREEQGSAQLPVFHEEVGPGSSLSLIGPQSLAEVIQFWIDCQPTNAEIFYTEVDLSNQELDELHAWAAHLQPSWEVVHTAGTNFLTIKPSRRKFTTTPGPITQAVPSDRMPGTPG